MNSMNRIAGLLAGLALSLTMLAPAVAAPKSPPPDPGAPGVVDMDRVFDEYRKTSTYAKYQQRLLDQEKTFTEEMTAYQKLRYCTDAERTEAATLRGKAKPTEQEKSRLAALEGRSDALDSELGTLSQKPNPTSKDTDRIQELAKIRAEAEKAINKEVAARQSKLAQLRTELNNNVQDEILKIVEKVAKEQKLAAIYDRRALLYGGNDVTDAVVKKLPK